MRYGFGPGRMRLLAISGGMLATAAMVTACSASTHVTTQSVDRLTTSARVAAPSTAQPSRSATSYTPMTKAQLATLLPPKSVLPVWKAEAGDDSPETALDRQESKECATCLDAMDTPPLQVATASSPTFSRTATNSYQAISVSVTSYRTVAAVTSDSRAMRSARFVPCFTKELSAHPANAFGPGLTYLDSHLTVTTGPSAVAATVLDGTVRMRTKTGRTVVFGMSQISLARQGIEESIDITALGEPVPQQVAEAFIAESSKDFVRGSATLGA